MSEEQITEELLRLQKSNATEFNNKIIELIDENPSYFIDKEGCSDLEKIRNSCKINIIKIKIEESDKNDRKTMIHLRGQLIKLYKKQEKLETDIEKKMQLRYEKNELLKLQKSDSKDYRKSNSNIKISGKVGLTIKEIANTIEIFVSEKDVIQKVKNIIKETGYGLGNSVALLAGVSLAAQLIVGLPLSLSAIPSIMPLLGYIGLSSIIRNIITKTQFQKYEYYQSDKYKKYVEEFKLNNQDILNSLQDLIRQKKSSNKNEEIIKLNNLIISKIDEICSVIKEEGLKEAYELQSLSFLRENKKLLKEEIDEYYDEKNNDKEKYRENHKMLSKINMQIFKRENSIKKAVKHAGKSVVANTTVMVLAKSIITLLAPGSTYAIRGLQSFVVPVLLALVGGIIDIPTYTGKLKYRETSENVIIDPVEKEKWDKLFNNNKLQMA